MVRSLYTYALIVRTLVRIIIQTQYIIERALIILYHEYIIFCKKKKITSFFRQFIPMNRTYYPCQGKSTLFDIYILYWIHIINNSYLLVYKLNMNKKPLTNDFRCCCCCCCCCCSSCQAGRYLRGDGFGWLMHKLYNGYPQGTLLLLLLLLLLIYAKWKYIYIYIFTENC